MYVCSRDALYDWKHWIRYSTFTLCTVISWIFYQNNNEYLTITAAEDKNMPLLDEWTDKLKSYEIRALTLFKDLDLNQIEEDFDEQNDQQASVGSFDEF